MQTTHQDGVEECRSVVGDASMSNVAATATAGGDKAITTTTVEADTESVNLPLFYESFSFLPHILSLLQSIETNANENEIQPAIAALTSQFTAANELLSSFTALNLSENEQKRLIKKLTAVRNAKLVLARRYRLVSESVSDVQEGNSTSKDNIDLNESHDHENNEIGDAIEEAMLID